MSVNATTFHAHTSHPRARPVGGYVAAFFIAAAIFAGLLAAVFPPLLLLLLVILPGVVLAGILWPEVLIALLLLVATGFFPEWMVPSFGAGGGAVHTEDLLLASLLGVLVFRLLIKFRPGKVPDRAIVIPLLVVLTLMLFSMIYGAAFLGVDKKAALAEFRTYLYLLPLLFIPLLLDSEAAMRRLWRLIVIVMLLLAVGQVVQGLFNIPVLHGGRLETAVTLDKSYSDATRSTVPGIYLLIFGLLYALARAFGKGGRGLLWIPALALFAIAILVTYGRAIWLVSAAGMVMVGISLGARRMIQLSVLGAITLGIALTALAYLKPTMINAAADRLASIGTEVQGGSSLNWRHIENGYAWRKIQASPIAGIGLGASYKPLAGGLNAWLEQTRFIHNGYLYLVLKTGLIGFVIFAAFWSRLMRLGWSIGHQQSDHLRSLGNTYFVLTLLPLATALVRPEWADQGTLAVFAILGGFLMAYASGSIKSKTVGTDSRPIPGLGHKPLPQ
jgi:O-antigen ligase